MEEGKDKDPDDPRIICRNQLQPNYIHITVCHVHVAIKICWSASALSWLFWYPWQYSDSAYTSSKWIIQLSVGVLSNNCITKDVLLYLFLSYYLMSMFLWWLHLNFTIKFLSRKYFDFLWWSFLDWHKRSNEKVNAH